jgi:DNA-binding transcriptional ArsR family regulator
MHIRSLSRAVGVAPPSVLWHLDKLEEKGMVRSVASGRRRVFYPAEMLEPEDVALLSFIGPEKRAAVVRAVTELPAIPQKELLRRSGANGHTLQDLVVAGVLDVVKDGRHRRYYASDVLVHRREEIERRGRRLRQTLLSMLARQGLQPEARDTGRGVLEVKVRLGTSQETLRFCRNPYLFTPC